MIEICSIPLINGLPCHNAFAFWLDSTKLGIATKRRSGVAVSVTC